MDAASAVEMRGLSKRFKRYRQVEGYTTLKTRALTGLRRLLRGRDDAAVHVERELVLDRVDLVVPRGASVGIVGPNGAGKSTLLRLIAGIYVPDAGTVETRGRVAAMLELGAGFHPEFSGRENAAIYGILMGFTRREIDSRLGEILDFSELGHVIDAPVRTYSSGQVVRLAFSVVTHLDPDIFLIDEALAVGDGRFIAKCHDRLAALRATGKTLVVVTHNREELIRSCDLACVMSRMTLSAPMPPRAALDRLSEELARPSSPPPPPAP